jgi:hypothetical protein
MVIFTLHSFEALGLLASLNPHLAAEEPVFALIRDERQ